MDAPDTTPVELTTLASGSSGNTTFIRFGDTRLLVDAGISYRQLNRRLKSIDESIQALSGLLITHEHSDHIDACRLVEKNHPELPMYATFGTAEACGESDDWTPNFHIIEAQQSFAIDGVDILPFRISHDAREPVGFRFAIPGFCLGFASDLGRPTREVVDGLSDCQALVIESNYDAQMLRTGPYPQFLRRRIAGRGGHLSNRQARALLDDVAGPELLAVVLCHLSENNNDPDGAVATVQKALDDTDTRIVAAPRGEIGEPLQFTATPPTPEPVQTALPF